MRWFWIDRFTEFVAGQRAVAVKNVTLAESHLHEYFPSYPVMPNSLVLEGLAQTGGMLLGEQSQFSARIVLAKVSSVRYHFPACPGDTLRYTAELEAVSSVGARVRGRSEVGDRLQAEAELFLAILPSRIGGDRMFDPPSFARLLRLLGVYDVGVDSEGNSLEFPEAFRQAEWEATPLDNK